MGIFNLCSFLVLDGSETDYQAAIKLIRSEKTYLEKAILIQKHVEIWRSLLARLAEDEDLDYVPAETRLSLSKRWKPKEIFTDGIFSSQKNLSSGALLGSPSIETGLGLRSAPVSPMNRILNTLEEDMLDHEVSLRLTPKAQEIDKRFITQEGSNEVSSNKGTNQNESV